MHQMREIMSNTIFAMTIFGAVAVLLAFTHGNVDRILVRLFLELPLLVIAAGIGAFLISLVAGLIGNNLLGTPAIAALIAGVLGWAVAAPPSFAGLGYHWMLQPTFAAALALPWLTGSALSGVFNRSS
jgi:hypothetical protein